MVKRKRAAPPAVTQIPPGKRWLDEREAAFYLGMSPITLWRRRKKPKAGAKPVPFIHEGGRIMYDVQQLDAYMLAHQAQGGPMGP